MNWREAHAEILKGATVARQVWPEHMRVTQFIENVQVPLMVIWYGDDVCDPFKPSNAELTAQDWYLVTPAPPPKPSLLKRVWTWLTQEAIIPR